MAKLWLKRLARTRRVGVVALACGISAALGGPAGAAAALYASPTGSGTACTDVSPCSLPSAISAAGPGEDVFAIADQGDYRLTFGIATRDGVAIHLHGYRGRARLLFSSGGLRLKAGTADGLYVQADSASTAFALDTATSSADRVFARSGSTGHACYLSGATLTNSVCWAGSAGDLAVETDGSSTLRNVTAIGGTEAALKAFGREECSCATATVTLVNVIARSAANGVDLEASSDGTATLNIAVTSSNYATTKTTGIGAPSMTHVIADATSQSAPPSFVNAAAGDFHQAAGSPTIDAGRNDPANGTGDLDGNPRTGDGTTDIGAYEVVEAGPAAPDTRITKAVVKAAGRKATFAFEAVGTADGFQCALVKIRKQQPQPRPSFSTCRSSMTYARLRPGRYVFHVRAFNAAASDPTPATRGFRI